MISDRSSAQNCPTTLIGHSCKDSFLPNSNQLMEHLVAGIIDQNKSYKDAGIDLARVPSSATCCCGRVATESSATCSMELQSHYGADTGRPRSRMPYRTSVLNFFLSDPRARSAASRPCLLQFSPPRPRINSEPSHLQEDFKPPLEVNLFLSQPFRRLERIRKLREGQERLDVPVPPALPPLIRRRLRPNCGPGR